jgi:hypothetical protein
MQQGLLIRAKMGLRPRLKGWMLKAGTRMRNHQQQQQQ